MRKPVIHKLSNRFKRRGKDITFCGRTNGGFSMFWHYVNCPDCLRFAPEVIKDPSKRKPKTKLQPRSVIQKEPEPDMDKLRAFFR